MGRRTKYQQDFPERAKRLAEEGMIEAEIANQFGVSVTTFEDYKSKYPEFLEALKSGKAKTNNKVVSTLLKRALGYEVEEVKTEYAVDDTGKQGKILKVVKTQKHVAPDVAAIMAFLYNRMPEEFRQKQYHDLDVNFRESSKIQVQLGKLSDKQLKAIADKEFESE